MTGAPQQKKTDGNQKIHYKDAIRLLLFFLGYGDKWASIQQWTGVNDSTAYKVVMWILEQVDPSNSPLTNS